MNRNDLHSKRVRELLDMYLQDIVTEKLNEVYRDEDSSLDPEFAAMQATALEDDQW